jgi:hypothetical protein
MDRLLEAAQVGGRSKEEADSPTNNLESVKKKNSREIGRPSQSSS